MHSTGERSDDLDRFESSKIHEDNEIMTVVEMFTVYHWAIS